MTPYHVPRYLFIAAMLIAASVVPHLAWALYFGENLLTPLPAGWKIGFSQGQKGVSQIMEMVPEDQTVENWKQMITVQIFHTLKDVDPDRFGDQMAAGFQKACPKTQVSWIPQKSINDRRAVRFFFYNPDCGGRPAESLLLLVLQGKDALHVVQYAWRPTPPSERQVNEAKSFLDRTRFCDTRKGDCEVQMKRLAEEGNSRRAEELPFRR